MQFASTLYMKMLSMCPVQEEGNRGELRHCVNAPGNVNDDAFYNLFSYIMEPGRILYNLLKAFEPTLKLEKLGGDVVFAWGAKLRCHEVAPGLGVKQLDCCGFSLHPPNHSGGRAALDCNT